MFLKRVIALFCIVAAALLSACGGANGNNSVGVDGKNGETSNLQISGTAATGAAIVSGPVEAKCKVGTGVATTDAGGNYILNVTLGEQPCILRVTDPITKMQLHSIVEAGERNANITPATDLVAANTLVESPVTAFANYAGAQQQKITALNISMAVSRVQTASAALGIDADMTGIDIMKGDLQAATSDRVGNSADKKIDALMAALAAADKKISDLSNMLATATSGTTAASQLKSLVGNAQYSLTSCPAARSSDIWVLDLFGTAPMRFNVNFNAMLLTNLSSNIASAINVQRDAQGVIIPCAFTATVNSSMVEFRVTNGGIGTWKNATDFGITVPSQPSHTMTNIAFEGAYPTAGFLRERTRGIRAALPFTFMIQSDGTLQGYLCDLTKDLPDCSLAVDDYASDTETTCTPLSNGTLSCSSPNGLRATAVLFVTGGQVSMFMSVTQMPLQGLDFGGLIVMTKASPMKLPTVGFMKTAGSSWFAGIGPGTNTVVSGQTNAGRIESINASTKAYVSSTVGTSATTTSYINTPSNGFLFEKSNNGNTSISIGSITGWSMTMTNSKANTVYDGWYVNARTVK